MRSVVLGFTATLALGGAAYAQPAPNGSGNGTSGSAVGAGRGGAGGSGMSGPAPTTSGGALPAATHRTASNPPTSGTPAIGSDRNAASGNGNQAVATTDANSSMPAHGHNSFTRGEARRRIASQGYSHVTGLRLVRGVWQGYASKDGQTTGVWLDYKGNVGARS